MSGNRATDVGSTASTTRILAPRRFLVFFRAGRNSLHPRLLAEDPQRNWDCCVSWYSDPQPTPGAEFSCAGGDNKLEGFLAFREQMPTLSYEYILLADDDVYFRPGDISRLFDVCNGYKTYLTQPALTWDTHYNVNVTLANPACILRRVSFVEIMTPCLSAEALNELIDTFNVSRSTWGVDFTWAGRSQDKHPLHVVDAVRVEHTKIMDKSGGAFYRKMKAMGVKPEDELHSSQLQFPDFVGMRTERRGHVFRPGIPRLMRRPALVFFEKMKFLARQRKKLVRGLHGMKTQRKIP